MKINQKDQVSKLHLEWKKKRSDFIFQQNCDADTRHCAFYVCYTRFSTLPCRLDAVELQIGLGTADAISDEKSNLLGALLGFGWSQMKFRTALKQLRSHGCNILRVKINSYLSNGLWAFGRGRGDWAVMSAWVLLSFYRAWRSSRTQKTTVSASINECQCPLKDTLLSHSLPLYPFDFLAFPMPLRDQLVGRAAEKAFSLCV